MKASVDKPQWNPASSEQEVMKLVNQLRSHINTHFSNTFLTTTQGTGVATVVLSVGIPSSAVWSASIKATVRGQTLGHGSFWRVATFARDGGGAAAQVGATTTLVSQTDVGHSADMALNGNSLEWTVTDDGTQVTDWVVECSYQEIPRS